MMVFPLKDTERGKDTKRAESRVQTKAAVCWNVLECFDPVSFWRWQTLCVVELCVCGFCLRGSCVVTWNTEPAEP